MKVNTNNLAIIVRNATNLKKRLEHSRSIWRNTRLRLVFPPTLYSLYRSLAASCVLYNRIERSQGLFIC